MLEVLNIVTRLLEKADTIIVATDSDREWREHCLVDHDTKRHRH